jgi:hypothetical protein
MGTVCIVKYRHEIQEQKVVPVWYPGIYRPILSTVQNRQPSRLLSGFGMFTVAYS